MMKKGRGTKRVSQVSWNIMGNEKSFRKYTGSKRKPNESVCPLLEREGKPLAGDTTGGFLH